MQCWHWIFSLISLLISCIADWVPKDSAQREACELPTSPGKTIALVFQLLWCAVNLMMNLHILTEHHYWICLPNNPHLRQTVHYWKALSVFVTERVCSCHVGSYTCCKRFMSPKYEDTLISTDTTALCNFERFPPCAKWALQHPSQGPWDVRHRLYSHRKSVLHSKAAAAVL